MEKSIPLKEIVGFLPYKLKGKALHLPEEPTVELTGLGQRLGYTFDFWLPHKHGKTGMIAGLGNFMPLVRPISDLTKEITHNGETFVPIVQILKNISLFDLSDCEFEFHFDKEDNEYWATAYSKNKRYIDSVCYDGNVFFVPNNDDSYQPLRPQNDGQDFILKHHFDLFDWIKDGLAIDINTL